MKIYTPDESDCQANAVAKVFGMACMVVEGATFDMASHFCSDYQGGMWGFVTDDEWTVGFWVPLGEDTYRVYCDGNGYTNPFMQAFAFGAACTLMAVNHLGWQADATGKDALANRLSNLYHSLLNFVMDLSEQEGLDGEAVCGFID